MVHMSRYIIWKDVTDGDIVKADTFAIYNNTVQFIVNTPIGGTNPPRVVAQYNLDKIIGFKEFEIIEEEEK